MSDLYVRYTLVSPTGSVKSGRVKANELETILNLANEGYEILELVEEKARPEKVSQTPTPSEVKKPAKMGHESVRKVGPSLSYQDLKFLTLNLSELLRVGVSLLEAVQSIEGADKGRLGDLAAQLAQDLQAGHSLSSSLTRSPYHFDQTFIGMIRVGEESGRLPTVLSQLHQRITKSQTLRRNLVQASIYPAALVVASILLLAFVGLFVVPSILPVIQTVSSDIPWPTQVLLAFHAHTGKFLLAGTVAAACLPWLWSSNPVAVSTRQWLKYESPLFGALARTQAVNQFCGDLGLLLESGISVVKALGLIRFDDLALEAAKRRVIKNLINGDGLAEAFESERLFPHLLSVLLKVAEESGANLAEILQYQATLLEFEAEENKQTLSRLFEPVLVGVMGLIVGFVLLGVFLPIYSQLAANL